jgi:hypothetical protein
VYTEHKLHAAERQVLSSAPRFRQHIRVSNLVRAKAIVASVACNFTVLATAREVKSARVANELRTALNHIQSIQINVERGAADAALQAYADFIMWLPSAHERVGQMIGDDLGSRGGSTEKFQEAAIRAATIVTSGL